MVLLGAFLDKINVKSEENAMKNRVKELRDAKHLTQTGLALKVGSTQQTISKIEREIGVPKLDLALIMADFFNVTLEYLLRIFYEYPPFSFFCSIIRTVKNTFLEVVLC